MSPLSKRRGRLLVKPSVLLYTCGLYEVNLRRRKS